MNIDWIENITKKEAYNRTLEFAVAYGMTEDNSSTVTLLFQPGSSLLQEEVQTKALQFLDGIESPAVISIEPILTKPNEQLPTLYRSAGFKNFQLLPLYHIHILLIEEKYEVRSQRKKWEGLIKCKQRNLFQCKYIETNIRTTSNYITKFFEEKNDNAGVIGFYLPMAAIKPNKNHEPLSIREQLPNETISFQIMESFLFQTYTEATFIKCVYPKSLIKIVVPKRISVSNSDRALTFCTCRGIRPP